MNWVNMVNIGRKVPMHLYHIPVNIIQNVIYVLISQERLIWTGMSGEREHMLRKRLKPGFSLVLENKGWLDLRWSSTNRWGKQLGKKNCLEFKILKCPRTNLPWKYVLWWPEQWSSSEGDELTIYLLDPFIKGYV